MPKTTVKLRNPLFQQDLFHCILNYLVAPDASHGVDRLKESRPVLASLAQTCRKPRPYLEQVGLLRTSHSMFARVLDEEREKVVTSLNLFV